MSFRQNRLRLTLNVPDDGYSRQSHVQYIWHLLFILSVIIFYYLVFNVNNIFLPIKFNSQEIQHSWHSLNIFSVNDFFYNVNFTTKTCDIHILLLKAVLTFQFRLFTTFNSATINIWYYCDFYRFSSLDVTYFQRRVKMDPAYNKWLSRDSEWQ